MLRASIMQDVGHSVSNTGNRNQSPQNYLEYHRTHSCAEGARQSDPPSSGIANVSDTCMIHHSTTIHYNYNA